MASISELLKAGEGETLEFKESFAEERELFETLCAFSNSKGGTVLVGVRDDGRVKGVSLGRRTIEGFLNKCKSLLEPPFIPHIEETRAEGKTLIVIRVAEGINKPYFFRGVAFKRVGASNQRVPKDELERMILAKHRLPFENTPIEAGLEDIDEGLVSQFVREARVRRGVRLEFRNKREFLRKFGGLKNGRPTVSALLCFSRNPQVHFPYAIVKCGSFTGQILRREREVGGDLLAQVQGALEFIKESLTARRRIGPDGRMVEEFEIPLESIREAVVNALAHRDYSIPSPVYIRVSEQAVEIENPGELLPPLTPEELKREHPSILRNPKIANFFFMLGFVERWGRGTNRMVESCIARGLREPDFVERSRFFKVVLYREALNETERRVLELVRRGEVGSGEVARALGISERASRKYLSALSARGLVRRKRIGRRIVYAAS